MSASTSCSSIDVSKKLKKRACSWARETPCRACPRCQSAVCSIRSKVLRPKLEPNSGDTDLFDRCGDRLARLAFFERTLVFEVLRILDAQFFHRDQTFDDRRLAGRAVGDEEAIVFEGNPDRILRFVAGEGHPATFLRAD